MEHDVHYPHYEITRQQSAPPSGRLVDLHHSIWPLQLALTQTSLC